MPVDLRILDKLLMQYSQHAAKVQVWDENLLDAAVANTKMDRESNQNREAGETKAGGGGE